MSKEIKEKAKEYLQAQLSVLPTDKNKVPTVSTWKPYQTERIKEEELEALFSGANVKGLGIITGAISGGLEVIDVDCKYDIKGSLWEDLRGLIEDNLPEVYNSLVIAKTIRGGYHIYYRCSSITGNLKLSNREATDTEKAKGDKVKTLIETRGEGGYVIAPPTPGYNYLQGEPGNIPTISPEERNILLDIARSFNEIKQPEPKEKREAIKNYKEKYPGKTSLEDYDERGDLVGLLTAEGWSEVKETAERVILVRPGETSAKSSGNYHKEKNCLIVFSTSTQFEPGKPYSPSQAYNLLRCNGDWSKTALELGKQGYGDYKPSYSSKDLKTERIKVEVVNKVNRETSVISTPGESLKIENIQTAIGEEVVITSPGSEAQDEVIKAIDLILKTGKRVYIKEGGVEKREYSYYLDVLFKKYGTIQETNGELTDREIYSLLDEVVMLSTKLQPIDKDLLLKLFLKQPGVRELNISEEAINETTKRLSFNINKAEQAEDFKKLLTKVTEHQDKGEIDKALKLLESEVKEVKLKDKATEFNSLLLPTSEAKIKEDLKGAPNDLNTGYTIGGEEFLLPGGAITVLAGATGHGKTILSINTALNVATAYPDKKFIFFTYEEHSSAILQYFLNAYMDIELNNATYKKTNRRVIKEYFKTGSTQFIAKDKIELFESKKQEFFKTYIETGRILVKYVDYNSQELELAIRYLHKTEPNLGGVFIDYFQLLRLPETKKVRQAELKDICQDLKNVAVQTRLPLCLGAQFNREVTDLTKLHPTNIGEAGDIERIVNTLVGLWDLSKATVDEKMSKGDKKDIETKTGNSRSGMYLEILKSRDLPTGGYGILEYNGKTGKIKNSSIDFTF
jgi:hypothetical protein